MDPDDVSHSLDGWQVLIPVGEHNQGAVVDHSGLFVDFASGVRDGERTEILLRLEALVGELGAKDHGKEVKLVFANLALLEIGVFVLLGVRNHWFFHFVFSCSCLFQKIFWSR